MARDRKKAYDRSVEHQLKNMEKGTPLIEEYEEGQSVLVRSEYKSYMGLEARYNGPYKIVRKISPYVYDISLPIRGLKVTKVHVQDSNHSLKILRRGNCSRLRS